MRRLLLLGDSIRLSYQPLVTELLEGLMEVVGPAENCQYAAYTASRLGDWLDELGQPNLVHWNNGLHDIGCNRLREPVQYSVAAYLDSLRQILDRLRPTGATIIWATTTPVHPTVPVPGDQWTWDNADIARYNDAACDLMSGEGVAVNDLHALVWADAERLLADDRIHLNAAGQRVCAEAVAQAVNDF